jgi:transcriptional regulator with XRE-family HTH domain|nr:MAG TPA: terminase small subunit [Caudoviricetes sp.]
MAKGKYEEWLTEEKLTLLSGWARDGLTDEQIAHNMGISRSTLNEWKKKYSDISDTLKRNKEIVDIQVENALLRRALGYKYKETTRERIIDTGQKKRHGGESELTEDIGKMVITKEVIKEVVPDTTAQIFWLKNRRPDKWRDRPVPVNEEVYEDDGLLAALDAQIDDLEDDSYMLEDENEDS